MKAETLASKVRVAVKACHACPVNSLGWCRGLSAEAKAEVGFRANLVAIPAGSAIFQQGADASHAFMVLDGTARITKVLPDGQQASLGFRYSGDMMGYSGAGQHEFGAEAVDKTSVCRLDRRSLEILMARRPAMVRRMLDLTSRELSNAQDLAVETSCCGAEVRVESFFRSLADEQRRRGRAGPAFDLPMTRTDIGEALGMSMESVSRSVSALRRRGVIALDGHSSFEMPLEPVPHCGAPRNLAA